MCLLFDVANIQTIITYTTNIVTKISLIVILFQYNVTTRSFYVIYDTNISAIIGEKNYSALKQNLYLQNDTLKVSFCKQNISILQTKHVDFLILSKISDPMNLHVTHAQSQNNLLLKDLFG